MIGVFGIQETECSTPVVSGSYFRMIQPGGTETGPFVANADSSCANNTYTPLLPGTQGGLSTAGYQADPKPAFDAVGNGLADKIHKPQAFFGVDFACSTNKVDTQSGQAAPRPVIEDDGSGNLSGQTSAFGCAYNRQYFNQGAPKPDGETPGLTQRVSGNFVPATNRYSLEWRSTIIGGPFNGFTGVWHLEGVFKPKPTVTFNVSGASAGEKVQMNGKVTPATAGEPVKIKTQRKTSDGYKTVDVKATESDPAGQFSYQHAALKTGAYRARAMVAETAQHSAGKSPWKGFKVSAGSRSLVKSTASNTWRGLSTGSSAAGEPLYGIFEVAEGQCGQAQGIDSGSYFQMTQPGGNPDTGPYVENGDSPCKDKKVTPLSPGSDGGLSTSAYQPQPEPPMDNKGNGLAELIIQPQRFFGVDFACATNEKDPQTGKSVPLPEILHDGSGKLSGTTTSYACAWNNNHFNQGAPKPDGSSPGETATLTGTYDAATGAYVMEWRSTIVGGPFDKFTGTWHYEGTFREGAAPSGGSSASSSSSAGSSGSGSSGSASASGATETTVAGASISNEAKGKTKNLAFTGSPIPEGAGLLLILVGLAGFLTDRVARRRRGRVVRELRW